MLTFGRHSRIRNGQSTIFRRLHCKTGTLQRHRQRPSPPFRNSTSRSPFRHRVCKAQGDRHSHTNDYRRRVFCDRYSHKKSSRWHLAPGWKCSNTCTKALCCHSNTEPGLLSDREGRVRDDRIWGRDGRMFLALYRDYRKSEVWPTWGVWDWLPLHKNTWLVESFNNESRGDQQNAYL